MTDDLSILLKDEMDVRTFAFWRARKFGAWPHDSREYVFLGNAVHMIGAAMFPNEWTAETPLEAFLPILGTSRKFVTNGFDAVFACSIVFAEGPSPFEEFLASRRQWKSPLTPELWDVAHETYRAHYAGMLQRSRFMYSAVARTIAEAAALETLVLATVSFESVPVKSPSSSWLGGVAYQRIRECQANPEGGGAHAEVDIGRVLQGHSYPPLMPSHQWLFASRKSLDAMLLSFRPAEANGSHADPEGSDAEDVASGAGGDMEARARLRKMVSDEIMASPRLSTVSLEAWLERGAKLGLTPYTVKQIRSQEIEKIRDKESKNAWKKPGPKTKH